MTAQVFPIRPALTALHCSGCGAVADASCDCGLPYVPAIERAAKAVAANPEKSNRALAEEIGVGVETVRRARLTDPDGSVEPRVGRDGKVRRLPTRAHPEDADDNESPPSRKRDAFLIFANEAMLLAKYEGPVDDEVIQAARSTQRAWQRLVSNMEKGK